MAAVGVGDGDRSNAGYLDQGALRVLKLCPHLRRRVVGEDRVVGRVVAQVYQRVA